MSNLQIIVLQDDELQQLQQGGIWMDMDGSVPIIVAHESREEAIVEIAEDYIND